MKDIFNKIGIAALSALAFTACTPESFDEPNEANVPLVEDYETVVDVDQDTNIATFRLVDKDGNMAKEVYPIWQITTTTTKQVTYDGYKTGTIVLAGTYSYTMQVGNKHGISDGTKTGTFTINTTRYDFTDFVSKLTDGGTKEWRIYSAKAGHMGCGESVTNPTNWWSAGANDKEGQGIYDDLVSFTAGTESAATGAYSYSAGDDGTTFINNGTTELGAPGSGDDISLVCVGQYGAQTNAEYSLGYDADLDCVTITLPAKTLFPYMASNAMMDGSYTFYVTDINTKTMTCVLKLEGICWQFILVNGEDEETSTDFDTNLVNWCDAASDLNLGKAFNETGTMTFWFSDANWSEIKSNAVNFSYADGVYTITPNVTTYSEWQGQCTIKETALNVEAGEYYDFSCKVVASAAVDRVTIKINKDPEDTEGNDVNYLFYKNNFSLKKGENILRFAKVTPMNYADKDNIVPTSFNSAKFVFDIGGCAAGVELRLSDIIVQKHNPK